VNVNKKINELLPHIKRKRRQKAIPFYLLETKTDLYKDLKFPEEVENFRKDYASELSVMKVIGNV
jgi:glutamate synthase domain-containing protein 1